MNRMAVVIVVVTGCGLISCCSVCKAIDIVATGAWSPAIGAADLQGGAGTDLEPAYESNADQVTITISNTTGIGDNWRVDVKRTDSNWHGDYILSVKRTGAGAGGGSIAGGTDYQEVTTNYAALYSGTGDRNDIPIQFKLAGVSIRIPPDTYSTTITYTVVDTL